MNAAQARALAAEVLAGIAPEADLGTVGDGEDLRQALDLDSMDFMNFVIGLSERGGVNIPDADTPRLRTLGGVVAYFSARPTTG
ncbi:acyl carrier protein [Ramlibacter sp.]|uniref:acyl carrier protein n=1 Tax=Ramlibacter sp. TaxID=1917967 RepID=UPI002FC8ADD4